MKALTFSISTSTLCWYIVHITVLSIATLVVVNTKQDISGHFDATLHIPRNCTFQETQHLFLNRLHLTQSKWLWLISDWRTIPWVWKNCSHGAVFFRFFWQNFLILAGSQTVERWHEQTCTFSDNICNFCSLSSIRRSLWCWAFAYKMTIRFKFQFS